MNNPSLKINNADLDDLEQFRQFLDSQLSDLNVHPDAIYDILLATTEAITNIILHGYQGEHGPAEVEVKREDDSVVVYIRDEAPQFDPTQIPPPDLARPLEDRPMGGMGIHLMRQFLDRLLYRVPSQGGNELILIKENVINKNKLGG